MRNKAKKGAAGEKNTVQSRIDQKRGEIRRLQNRFATDSENLQLFMTNEERLRKFIKEIQVECNRLEDQLELARRGDRGSLDSLERELANQQAANRARVMSALRQKEKASDAVKAKAESLQKMEREIQRRVQAYKEMIRKRELLKQEERRRLEELEEEEAKMLQRAMRQADDLDVSEGFDARCEDELVDEHWGLWEEEQGIVKKIKMLMDLRNDLTRQVTELCEGM